jgi:hypothetical protein
MRGKIIITDSNPDQPCERVITIDKNRLNYENKCSDDYCICRRSRRLRDNEVDKILKQYKKSEIEHIY